MPVAVATSASRYDAVRVLRELDFYHHFRAVVTSDDVFRGKPDPAVYRLALSRLNGTSPKPEPPIQARECLVIEDSLAGIQSARAAGMQVLAVATTYPLAQLGAAQAVWTDLRTVDWERLEVLFG